MTHTMLTESQIRALIIERLEAISGGVNSTFISHNDGVFRGLLWVLTGQDPGCYLRRDIPEMLELARIPYRVEGDMVIFGESITEGG